MKNKKILKKTMVFIIVICLTFSLVLTNAYALSEPKVGSEYKFYVPGDSSSDKTLNIKDVSLILEYIVNLKEETEIDIKAADYNGDGKVNIVDVSEILKSLVGLEYDCIVHPDDSYKDIELIDYGGEINDNTIDFVEMVNADRVIISNYNLYYEPIVAFIDNQDEFFTLFNRVSDVFDEAFFVENSLIIYISEDGTYDYFHSITNIAAESDILYVVHDKCVPNDNIELPAFRYWHLFYSVKKADVEGVTKIAIKNTTSTYER